MGPREGSLSGQSRTSSDRLTAPQCAWPRAGSRAGRSGAPVEEGHQLRPDQLRFLQPRLPPSRARLVSANAASHHLAVVAQDQSLHLVAPRALKAHGHLLSLDRKSRSVAGSDEDGITILVNKTDCNFLFEDRKKLHTMKFRVPARCRIIHRLSTAPLSRARARPPLYCTVYIHLLFQLLSKLLHLSSLAGAIKSIGGVELSKLGSPPEYTGSS